MPYETAYLRARALVARELAQRARDRDVATLLLEVSEEFEAEARSREKARRGSRTERRPI